MVIFPSNKEEDGGRRKPGMRNRRGKLMDTHLEGKHRTRPTNTRGEIKKDIRRHF